MDNEESVPRVFAKALLAALQLLALALCALVLTNMLVEEKLRLPHHVCVLGPDTGPMPEYVE